MTERAEVRITYDGMKLPPKVRAGLREVASATDGLHFLDHYDPVLTYVHPNGASDPLVTALCDVAATPAAYEILSVTVRRVTHGWAESF